MVLMIATSFRKRMVRKGQIRLKLRKGEKGPPVNIDDRHSQIRLVLCVALFKIAAHHDGEQPSPTPSRLLPSRETMSYTFPWFVTPCLEAFSYLQSRYGFGSPEVEQLGRECFIRYRKNDRWVSI